MIKQLHFKWMLLLCALMVGTNVAWADTSTLTFTAACGGSGTADDGVNWTVTSDGTESAYDDTKGIHYGTGSAAVQYIKLTTNGISGTITQVVVNASTASGVSATASVTVGGSAFGGSAKTLSSTATNYTFTGSASGEIIVTVTKPSSATKALYVKSVAVTYTAGGGGSTVATPTISPTTGTYATAKEVTITCSTDGATIHYTTNGDDPTETDATYSSAIFVTKTGTILKAKAFKDGMTASSVASATYTIKPNTPVISAEGATVTITGDAGCTFYYTTDNSAPSSSSTEYTGPFTQTENCFIRAIAYDAYDNASDVKSYNFKYMPLSPKNANSGYYVKVTNISDLEDGDAILIVNETAKKALGAQNSNNCQAKDVTISSSTISSIGDAQKLVVIKKTEKVDDVDTDVFYFYTGSGYLYAASNSSNYLKQQDPATTNARATIEISSGDATIKFRGTYSRNWLRYNSSSNIFSCYESGQDPVQIYKEVVPMTITSAGWASFSNANELAIPAGVTAYYAQKKDGSNVTLKEIAGGYIPANTGVVLSGAADTYSANVTATGATLGAENILYPWLTAGEPTEPTYYTLAVSGGKPIFKKSSGGTLAAGKAYLVMPAGSAELTVDFDDENGGDVVTGIDTIEHSTLNIEHSEVYNLNGQRVSQPTKGLYIVNGKKVVVK